jgi:disulfide bond formation protein DsbB
MAGVVPVVVTFLAILALVALAGAIVLIIGPRSSLVPQIGPVAANLAWAVAVVSTLGSLFLSEVANFIPCLLCWVQRGFMYPLAIALAVPGARRSRAISIWALAGSLVSIYHYAVEQIPGFSGSDFCSATIPCSFIWVEEFGFVTIPFMALCGFLAIAALALTHRRWLRSGSGA